MRRHAKINKNRPPFVGRGEQSKKTKDEEATGDVAVVGHCLSLNTAETAEAPTCSGQKELPPPPLK
jgi:hypothetical protein